MLSPLFEKQVEALEAVLYNEFFWVVVFVEIKFVVLFEEVKDGVLFLVTISYHLAVEHCLPEHPQSYIQIKVIN